MNKRDYNKLNKEYNNYIKSGDYNKPKTLKLEHMGFFPKHLVNAGRNRVSELLDFSTEVVDIDNIFMTTNSGTFVSVYANATCEGIHAFGRYRNKLIRYKKNGKYGNFSVIKQWDSENINVGAFESVFGYDISKLYPKEFKSYADIQKSEIERIKDIEEAKENRTDNSTRDFTKELYTNIVNYDLEHDMGHCKSLQELCNKTKVKLLDVITYTHTFSFSPDYVNITSRGIEFGYMSNSTYNSLPFTLKISKVSEIKTIKLADLGIEGTGYYSHGDNMRILPEQIKAAKKFNKRFNKVKKDCIEKILKGVI